MLNDSANKLISRCFSKQELEFLRSQSEFTGAVAKMVNMDDAEATVAIGSRLLGQRDEQKSPWYCADFPPSHDKARAIKAPVIES